MEVLELFSVAIATGVVSSGATVAVLKNDMKYVWKELARQDKAQTEQNQNIWTKLSRIEETLRATTH